jgi:hypothetical protein
MDDHGRKGRAASPTPNTLSRRAPGAQSQRACVFCDAPAKEYEHVIPKWLTRHRSLKGVMSHDRAIGVAQAEHVRVDDFKAKIVCASCHDAITDTIENPAVPLLKELFKGEAQLLTVDEQRILAAWGAKTACMLWGMMQAPVGVPVAHRRHLIANAEPHPAVYVAYSRFAGGSVRVKMAPRTRITLREDGRHFWVYDAALVFETFGLKVYGPCDRELLKYKQATSFATVVWPSSATVARWPPGRLLDAADDGFAVLFDFDPRAGRKSR